MVILIRILFSYFFQIQNLEKSSGKDEGAQTECKEKIPISDGHFDTYFVLIFLPNSEFGEKFR